MTEITRMDLLARMPAIMLKYPSILRALKDMRRGQDDRYSMGLLLERHAASCADQAAIVFEEQVLTYREFNERVNRVAHYLAARGLGKGQVVALMMENRPEFLICFCAAMKLGAVTALINSHLKQQGLAHCLNICEPQMFIIGEEVWDAFASVRGDLAGPSGRDVFFAADTGARAPAPGSIDLFAECRGQPVDNPPSTLEVRQGDTCGYVYTSGTTGLPKAAILTHMRLMKGGVLFGRMVLNTRRSDRIYIPLPFYHSTALNIGWSVAMNAGCAVVIARKFSASRYWDDVRRYGVTILLYVGEVCRYLMNAPPRPDDADNPAFKMVGSGMRPDIWRDFKRRFGVREVYEFYGASDGNMTFVNLFNLEDTVGMGLTPFAIVAFDTEREQPVLDARGFMIPVAVGEVGLVIGKISEQFVFDGYTNRGDSEKKILRNVFKQGDAWFNSGDLFRNLGLRHAQFVDRVGDTFRWRGENVATSEVEGVLNGFAGVDESTVYGVEVPGADGRAGMASIALGTPPEQFDFGALASYLRGALPAYAVPLFLRLRTTLEVTGTFKHRKVDLKAEGFDTGRVADPVYVMLPGSGTYVPLTDELLAGIQRREYRF